MNRCAAALPVLACLPLLAQPQASGQRYQEFRKYLARRGAGITASFPGDIRTLDEWKRRRPELLRQARYVLGLEPLPARTPLNARVTGGFARPGYRVENIVFESMPRVYVTGNLYLPDKPGRLPAVIYLSGHAPGPAGAKVYYQEHGAWLARYGYAAFVLDTIEFGEISGIHHGLHNLEMWDWLARGYTPAGPEVWNAVRALDYLETRPDIDRARVAVTGISGGGAITWYAAAVDERFRVAAPVCGTWSVHHQLALDSVQENCDCIYFQNAFLADLPALGALIAPRPLDILSARRDPMFPPAGYHDVYQRVRAIYDLYGAADKIAEYDEDVGHRYTPGSRKHAYEWIGRWLSGNKQPFVEDKIEREQPETLTVLKEPHGLKAAPRNAGIHEWFVPEHRPVLPRTAAAWHTRRSGLLDSLKQTCFRAFPKATVPLEASRRENTGWIRNYTRPFRVEFTTEAGLRITGELFLPLQVKPSYPGLVYVKGRGDLVYSVDYDLLLETLATHAVLVLHPRTVDIPLDNYRLATIRREAALLGGTLESMQVWDILRGIDFLRENARLDSLSVYARREMGVPAIYAAALDDRITRVVLEDPPHSHRQGPALLNVLRVTDLPEAAALIAPRELVSIGPLPAAYSHTAAIYGLGKQKIREASSLGEALALWNRQ